MRVYSVRPECDLGKMLQHSVSANNPIFIRKSAHEIVSPILAIAAMTANPALASCYKVAITIIIMARACKRMHDASMLKFIQAINLRRSPTGL